MLNNNFFKYVKGKRYISFFWISVIFISCSGNQNSESSNLVADDKYKAGEKVYETNCAACHQSSGEGVEGAFPPLAKSDYLLADKNRAIKQIIHGSSGEIVVNGVTYNSIMPPQPISDQEIVDVMNFILNSWGNNGGEVTLEEVKAQR